MCNLWFWDIQNKPNWIEWLNISFKKKKRSNGFLRKILILSVLYYRNAVSFPDRRPHGERGRRDAADTIQQGQAGTGAHGTGHLTGKHREAAQGKAACTHTHTHTHTHMINSQYVKTWWFIISGFFLFFCCCIQPGQKHHEAQHVLYASVNCIMCGHLQSPTSLWHSHRPVLHSPPFWSLLSGWTRTTCGDIAEPAPQDREGHVGVGSHIHSKSSTNGFPSCVGLLIYSWYGKYSDPFKMFTLCFIAAIC